MRKVGKRGRRKQRDRAKLTAELITPGVTQCAVRSPVCIRYAQHLHHIFKSGQGGSDERKNVMPACDPCNGWIEDNPIEAHRRGLVIKSWEGAL
jgi:5-methylcytosine-specific restriction endonuclease McrA